MRIFFQGPSLARTWEIRILENALGTFIHSLLNHVDQAEAFRHLLLLNRYRCRASQERCGEAVRRTTPRHNPSTSPPLEMAVPQRTLSWLYSVLTKVDMTFNDI